MTIQTIENLFGTEIVVVTNADGSIWSGLKSTWDDLQAEHEQGTKP